MRHSWRTKCWAISLNQLVFGSHSLASLNTVADGAYRKMRVVGYGVPGGDYTVPFNIR